MTMHHGHTSHDHIGGGFAPMTIMLFALLIGLLMLFLVFAWNPWTTGGNGSGGPGQGGSDEPAQQQTVPNQPEERLPR